MRLLPPTMINFIRFETPAGKRQDGLKDGFGIGVEELDESEAKAYAQLMSDTFLAHWKEKRTRFCAEQKTIYR